VNAQIPALHAESLHYTYRRKREPSVEALCGVSFEIRHGTLSALIGPDGAGKTTLMRLAAALLRPESGTLKVLDLDVTAHPQEIQDRISYMPQRFGLYEDLTVAENLDLYADLHGVTAQQRAQRYPQLMAMTALGPFRERLAGRLSGGMKQKLGLACTLVRSPQLLLLDEPTVGVDPLSRRELWEIVHSLVTEQGLTVLLSTAYLDEAERCSHIVLLNQGRLLSQGTPAEVTQHAQGLTFIVQPQAPNGARALQAQLFDQPDIIDAVPDAGRVRFVRAPARNQATAATDALLQGLTVTATEPSFEDGFMTLLRQIIVPEGVHPVSMDRPVPNNGAQQAVTVRQLVKRFGDFTAVDQIGFDVHRGEIFGLLGPNGAGKTTTFRMLCGLLSPSGGELRVAGTDVRRTPAAARERLGYVAQKFSLSGRCRSPKISNSSPAPTDCAALGGDSESTGPYASSSWQTRRAPPARCCLAASSSASQWPQRCFTSPRSSFLMNRPAAPTHMPGASSGDASPRCRNRASRSSSPLTSCRRRSTAIAWPSWIRAACSHKAHRVKSVATPAVQPHPTPAWKTPLSPSSSARVLASRPPREGARWRPGRCLDSKAAAHPCAGAQGDFAGIAGSLEHRNRSRAAADPHTAVRLRPLTRCQTRPDRPGHG